MMVPAHCAGAKSAFTNAKVVARLFSGLMCPKPENVI